MDEQLTLHNMLLEAFPTLPAYFRPPTKLMLVYPCVVYDVRGVDTTHASGRLYSSAIIFTVSFLSEAPGSTNIIHVLDRLKHSAHDTTYLSKDIVHDVFTVYVR